MCEDSRKMHIYTNGNNLWVEKLIQFSNIHLPNIYIF